jgi:3-methyladenine DNA glycosylase/8-oxoguanine DNA glycosylase
MTTATPQVPVSWGEVIDKITILEIKSEKLASPDALANVRTELALLAAIARDPLARNDRLSDLKAELQAVNHALWDIEDAIREKESRQEFDDGFIALARSVYRQNDERAAIKRRINDLLGSEIVEEKSYRSY